MGQEKIFKLDRFLKGSTETKFLGRQSRESRTGDHHEFS